jgi:hypothetical protein
MRKCNEKCKKKCYEKCSRVFHFNCGRYRYRTHTHLLFPIVQFLFSQICVELFAASVVGKIFLHLIFCVFGGGEFPVALN